MNTLGFGMPGGWEWLVIGVVMLLLFGSRLPSVARSIGDALREFKKGVHDIGAPDEPRTPPKSQNFSSARPPLSSGGVDQRVSHGSEPEPVSHEQDTDANRSS